MGVSSTARLPSLGAQSIPPLFSHLQHTSNAKVVSRWSITIRSFRAVPVPTNAWPAPDQYDSSFSPLPSASDDTTAGNGANVAASSSSFNQAGGLAGTSTSGGAGSSASGAPPLTKPRTMWQVWISDHPGVVFVIVEDTGRSSRAKAWRDWEVSMKKWKKEKRNEIEARRKKQEKAQNKVEKMKVQSLNAASGSTTGAEDSKGSSDETAAASNEGGTAASDRAKPMDVDATSLQLQEDAGLPAITDEIGAMGQVQDADDETIKEAGPKPKLRLPSHTRYTVSALSSSMSAMLTGLNLPPPHGAPVGTAGPGAWVPRGAAVSIEGLVLEINSQSLNALPGISPALACVSSTDDAATFSRAIGTGSSSSGVDWRVRVGSVMGGGGRSAGAIVEAEFLPVSTLLPTSKFMYDFLHSLFPPGLVPMPPPVPAPGMPTQNPLRGVAALSRTASATGTPRANNATLGPVARTNGGAAAGIATSAVSGFSYTIGGGASAPPNPTFNIPVVSDQLWEEVVPRSGENWRRRIVKRSLQLRLAARAQRRQRRNAAATTATQDGVNCSKPSNGNRGNVDVFGWYSFGSDDEAQAPGAIQTNGDWQDEMEDEVSSSDSEAETTLVAGSSSTGSGCIGTAVTMQQVDEDDDDDDDDRPLGAPAWSNASRTSSVPNAANLLSTSGAATAPDAVVVKKDDTVQLIFQGLRPEEKNLEGSADVDGWTGIERGRRIAFQYVQMLRAEGII